MRRFVAAALVRAKVVGRAAGGVRAREATRRAEALARRALPVAAALVLVAAAGCGSVAARRPERAADRGACGEGRLVDRSGREGINRAAETEDAGPIAARAVAAALVPDATEAPAAGAVDADAGEAISPRNALPVGTNLAGGGGAA